MRLFLHPHSVCKNWTFTLFIAQNKVWLRKQNLAFVHFIRLRTFSSKDRKGNFLTNVQLKF